MKGCLVKLILNLVVLLFAVCAIAFCNKFIENYFEICAVGVVIISITLLSGINRPSIKEQQEKYFKTALANLCVIMSNVLLVIDEYLIDNDDLAKVDQPVVIDEAKHPVIFCNEFVNSIQTRIPDTLSQEKKDYSDIASLTKEHTRAFYQQLNSDFISGCENKDLLEEIEKVYVTLEKLEKSVKSKEITQKVLYDELSKLFLAIRKSSELILEYYSKQVKRYRP